MRRFKGINYYPLSSYLKAGCFLHLITLAEIVLLCLLFSYLSIFTPDSVDGWCLSELLLVFFLTVLPLFSQLDARSRYQNYKQLKDQLFLYGFDRRILKPILQSRCQRDAALAAAEELGYGESCRAYFKNCGYKWFHLVPDFVFRTPHFFLTRAFWKRTFFMPTYRPRVDYRREYICA